MLLASNMKPLNS
jgi:hypothetical protein